MAKHEGARRGVTVLVGLVVGLAVGASPGCAGKNKGSRNPEQCMQACEEETCAYDPNAIGNEEYLECLEACQDDCS